MTEEELNEITNLIIQLNDINRFKVLYGDAHADLKAHLESSEFFTISGVKFDSKKLLSIMPLNDIDRELNEVKEKIANFKTK